MIVLRYRSLPATFVVLVNSYDGNEQRVRSNTEYIQQLLRQYAQSDGGTYHLYRYCD